MYQFAKAPTRLNTSHQRREEQVCQTKNDIKPRIMTDIICTFLFLNTNKPDMVSITQIATAILTVHCTKKGSRYASIYHLISCAKEYTLTAFIRPENMKHTPSVMRKAAFIMVVLLISNHHHTCLPLS